MASGRNRSTFLDSAERFLDRSSVRAALASLIVASVLPLEALRAQPWLDWAFFVVFGTEITLRVAILKRERRLNRVEAAVLVADCVALLSFLPLHGLVDTRLLRLIRLVRLVVLGRFLRTLAMDLRRILAQRQMRYQLGFLLAAVLLLTFLGATVLSTFDVAIEDFDGDGAADRGTPIDVLWWTFRQIEDPGNLVEEPGGGALLVLTSLVLTIAGVFVMSFIIGIGTSVVGSLMVASRHRPVSLREHTLVIGGGRNVREVLDDLVEVYAKNRRRVRVALLDDGEAPPPYLEEPRFRGVEYRTGEATSLDAHRLLGTSRSKRAIVLNDGSRGEAADAYAVSAVLAIREQCEGCAIVVEMRHRRYLTAVRVAGGQNVNPIPMGQFLGSLLSHTLMFPGIDEVFEELLTTRGSEIYSHIYGEDELAALRVEADGEIGFRELLLELYREDGVILIGLFLGQGAWTNDPGELVLWLNPLDDPPEETAALGARTGAVPLASLRGAIAVCPEYSLVRKAAAKIARRRGPASHPRPSAAPELSVALADDMVALERVLVLGDNELLPAMAENTAEFVPGVSFLAVPALSRLNQVRTELRRRTGPSSDGGAGARRYPLAREGSITLIPSGGDLLADALEHPLVASGPVDVVVVLADPQEQDPDAQSALTLLRLLERVETGDLRVGPRFRIVVEALDGPKASRLEARLSRRTGISVRVVPTQQMRAYFLVDAAYMPGSERAHLELVSPRGQDFCQLRLLGRRAKEAPMGFDDLMDALAGGSPPVIVIGVVLRGPGSPRGRLVLNPDVKNGLRRFRPSEVEAVYAVGETERIARVCCEEGGA